MTGERSGRSGRSRGSGGSGRNARRIALVAAAGIVVAAVTAVIGVPLGFAIAFGLIVALSVAAWHGLPVEGATRPEPERRPSRPGTRPDVSSLTWALSSRGRGAGAAGIDRVREIARGRLARHGLDLENPGDRAELQRLFGPAGMLLLTPGGGRAHSLDTVAHVLDALDRLDRPDRPDREPSDHRQERRTA